LHRFWATISFQLATKSASLTTLPVTVLVVFDFKVQSFLWKELHGVNCQVAVAELPATKGEVWDVWGVLEKVMEGVAGVGLGVGVGVGVVC
jgi:hypothetical protein